MEKYEAYQPPKRKGFYLDPRTKILFMAFVTTLMFFVYENLAMDAVVAIIPLTLTAYKTVRCGRPSFMEGCSLWRW